MDSVTQKIIRLVDNEFLAILVMGDSTLLLRHVNCWFLQRRYSLYKKKRKPKIILDN